jgi:arabinofuranosyltransferase
LSIRQASAETPTLSAIPPLPKINSADRLHRLFTAVGLSVLLVVLIRTAWISDDAFISFRTADNFVHGFGLRWNVSERVQSYTHPLWLGVFTAAYAVTREPYYTAIALSLLLTVVAVLILSRRVVATPWHVLAAMAALCSSKAFVDYATSGLENALGYALLTLFLWRWWVEPPGAKRTRRLFLIAAFCLLNRMDLALLVAPALAVEMWRRGVRASLGPAMVGMLPFVAWEIFSMVYYGFAFPNTAYAKLNTGLPAWLLVRRGVEYAYSTALFDPVTLPVMGLSILAVVRRSQRDDWPLVAGLTAYLAYVVRIGGDFMFGRFFTMPFVWSVGLLAHAPWPRPRVTGWVAATAVVMLGLSAPWEPALLSGFGFWRAYNLAHGSSSRTPIDNYRYLSRGDADDERRVYYDGTGLLEQRPGRPAPNHVWSIEGLRLRTEGPRAVVEDSVGFRGYFAGPAVHIVDAYALCDALLARLPPLQGGRIGHFRRAIPDGYIATIESGTNHLADSDLARYYDQLHVIVAGPIWSADRFAAIVSMWSGQDDHYLLAANARAR